MRELDHLVVSALTVVALISTLAGIAVGYLFSQLLLKYGGSGYVIDALGLATARDLAPLAAALLLAGRSGSAIATELGTMRITQELDALQTMSIDVWSRVVLPKTIALTLGLPALTLWSAIFTMLGGVWICSLELPLTFTQMIGSLPGKLPLTNLFLGLGKAIVFGIGIGVLASYFGYTCQPNTQSMARKTTNSVVVCIAFVLLGNAYLDIISRTVGLK
ncbi:MAG: ABC transporter permease [Pseudomonadales bacterium]